MGQALRVAGLVLLVAARAWAGPLPASAAEGAQLLPGLGQHHRAVSTRSPEAQAYFDQGLRLLYGFNHDEAFRSFAKAAELDPGCALCFWGASFALGPNYNVPMLPDRARLAWDALQAARRLSAHATPAEQALIAALSVRYRGPAPLSPEAQHPLDARFAQAMRQAAHRFPRDLDIQTLFAESLMDVDPWRLWTLDGRPGRHTKEILATLEAVLQADPDHPGANHYLIHATEASPHPERALASAERLPRLMPGAGHVVHMPSHTLERLGRYEEAAEANRQAIRADLDYLARAKPTGYYPMYLSHNYSFLAQAASAEGRSAEAIQAAREGARTVAPEMSKMMPGADFARATLPFALVRFGRWDELLALPRPDPADVNELGIWHFGRGMARAARGQPAEAEQELGELTRLRERVPADSRFDLNPTRAVLAVAADTLAGHLAWARGDPATARARLTRAVAREDALAYAEPPDWFFPVRHPLGAVLLASGDARAAEAVYRKDLARNPHNGWALFGLWHALEAQGRDAEASQARADFEQAWARADVTLTASAFLGPRGQPAHARQPR